MLQEYKNLLTKQEDQLLFLLQVVLEHRAAFLDGRKATLSRNRRQWVGWAPWDPCLRASNTRFELGGGTCTTRDHSWGDWKPPVNINEGIETKCVPPCFSLKRKIWAGASWKTRKKIIPSIGKDYPTTQYRSKHFNVCCNIIPSNDLYKVNKVASLPLNVYMRVR